MAIIWTPNIEVVNLAEDRVRFSMTRLNDVTGKSRTYSAGVGIVTTSAHKRAMEDKVWDKYQKALVNESSVAAKISVWQTEAKTNLEARES